MLSSPCPQMHQQLMWELSYSRESGYQQAGSHLVSSQPSWRQPSSHTGLLTESCTASSQAYLTLDIIWSTANSRRIHQTSHFCSVVGVRLLDSPSTTTALLCGRIHEQDCPRAWPPKHCGRPHVQAPTGSPYSWVNQGHQRKGALRVAGSLPGSR